MSFKKIILFLLLLFSLLSLFVIVYFSKNRIGMFGKIYDDHVKRNTEIISKTVQININTIKNEINSLSQENVVREIFEAHYLSLDKIDSKKINEIAGKIQNCAKIQLLDRDGLIIFSTLEDESYKQKIKSTAFEKIKSHFSQKDSPYFYFLNNQQFITIKSINILITNEIKEGYIAIYYNSQKLLNGLNQRLKVPFSFDSFMFLSKGNIDNKDVNLIIENYEKLKDAKKDGLEKTIGGISYIDGIKVIYYSKNEKFISPWTILFLLIDLILLMLVVLTLLQLLREEKMYKEVALNTLKTDTVPERSEIGDLVRDIEEDNIEQSELANQGIEQMIMQNKIDLYQEPKDFPKEKELEKETFTYETKYEAPIEEKEPSVATEDFETEKTVSLEPETISTEDLTPSSEPTTLSTYDNLEPDHKTKIFAEEENILHGITNDYIEKEESLKGVTPEDHLTNIEETIEFNIPEVENIPVESENIEENLASIDNLTQIEEATPVQKEEEKIETIEEIEEDLKNVMEEPPHKISTIGTVEDYGKVAFELAKNYLGMSKIMILKRENNHFSLNMKENFSSDVSFTMDDPLVTMFLSKGKSISIKGNINSRYVRSKFNEKDIENLEEIFVVPIAKKGELVGVGFFGREKGVKEPTNFQKSELFNMGYLQEE